jgi:hypothetical protein
MGHCNEKEVKHISAIFDDIIREKPTGGPLTFETILKILGNRAFGMALIFFALPTAMPFAIIPGVSFIFSIPITIFAIQILLLRETIWLPNWLGQHVVVEKNVEKVAEKAKPYLIKIEKVLKPRLLLMTSPLMQVLNGLFILMLSFFLMLPIPFSNFVFSGLILLFGFGLVAKDGLFILLGYAGGILYFSLMYTVIVGVM